MHEFGNDIFAQHRSERGITIAAAREGRSAGTLELDVTASAVLVNDLADQDGAAIAELR